LTKEEKKKITNEAKKLLKALKGRGKTQQDIAIEIGCTQGWIAAVKSGAIPSDDFMSALRKI
jgi:transcriptional regulator with XRE-family HTH domain